MLLSASRRAADARPRRCAQTTLAVAAAPDSAEAVRLVQGSHGRIATAGLRTVGALSFAVTRQQRHRTGCRLNGAVSSVASASS